VALKAALAVRFKFRIKKGLLINPKNTLATERSGNNWQGDHRRKPPGTGKTITGTGSAGDSSRDGFRLGFFDTGAKPFLKK